MKPKSPPPPSADEIANLDRLSRLPDELAHHILSFLPITDLIRFGVVSERCRNLYLSSPTLNLTEFPPESIDTHANRDELMSSLNAFLCDRGYDKVRRFHIDWVSEYHSWDDDLDNLFYNNDDEKSTILNWMQCAVEWGVEALDVRFQSVLPYPFDDIEVQDTADETPLCLAFDVIAAGYLKSLSFDMTIVSLSAPGLSACSVSNLAVLRLRNLTMDDGVGFCKWVSLCCKFLEELRLEHVVGLTEIDINSSSLKTFEVESHDLCRLSITGEKLEQLVMRWHFTLRRSKTNSMQISAPKLKFLKWIGQMMKCQRFGEFPCLEEAQLFPMCEDLDDLGSKLNVLFSSIRHVKTLVIGQETIKSMFKEGYNPPPFHNLGCLDMPIFTNIDDDLVPAMVSLFKGAPNFNSLKITGSNELSFYNGIPSTADSCGFDGKFWELQNLGFISHLKEVTIELTHGCNGFKFARYLVEHAQNLEKMIVFYDPNQVKFTTELRKPKENLSNASVILLKKMQHHSNAHGLHHLHL